MKKILLTAATATALIAVPAAAGATPAEQGLVAAPVGLPGLEPLPAPTSEELEETGKGALKLLKTSVKAYSKVGWELGRLTSKHDPGPYPGFKKAVLPSLPKPGKKGR